MWVSLTLCERSETNQEVVAACDPLLAMVSSDITSVAIARGCYQMVTIAMGEDMISPKTVATEGHSSNGWFSDITDKSL
jgi:hypothetical protein